MKMNFCVGKPNVTLKQGYLYIKRERNSDRVPTRFLSKPWQRAYFILYRDPIFFEEFKDASLKSRKHIHLISIIKHVGPIKTSIRKPHAFEVIDEKATLLLACDNEILLEEWTKVFIEVMNKRKMQSRCEMEKCPSGTREGYYSVEIVDTTLSGVNELHGEYMAVISNTRMSLLDADNNNEVLSWPLSHITIHNSQPSQNRIILVMGRNCHFGSGKLIFATKEYAQIMSALNSLVIRKKTVCGTVSTPHTSPIRDSPGTSSFTRPKLLRQTGSIDDIMDNEEAIDVLDGKAVLRRSSLQGPHGSCPNINEVYTPLPSTTRKVSACSWERNDNALVPPHAPDGYIEPNAIPEEGKKTNKQSFIRGSPHRTSMASRPSSLTVNDDGSIYLDLESGNIVDDVVTGAEQLLNIVNSPLITDQEVRLLRQSIMGELEDPQRHTGVIRRGSDTTMMPTSATAAIIREQMRSSSLPDTPLSEDEPKLNVTESPPCEERTRLRNESSPLPSSKVAKPVERRRVSEPIKKFILDTFDHVRRPKHSFGIEPQHSPDSRNSPRLSPKQKVASLPKQRSMVSMGVFEDFAKKSLIQNKSPFEGPKGEIVMPSLLSNALPSLVRKSNSRPCSSDFSRDSLSVTVTTIDEPPPLPVRKSPELLQRAHDLTITIREEAKDCCKTTPEIADNRIGSITVNSSRIYTSVSDPTPSEPPPIPPKSKLLTLTKSSVLVTDKRNAEATRRLSCGEDMLTGEYGKTGSEKDDASPPAVPERNYNIRNMVKPSASNQFRGSTNETSTKKRQSPLAFKPPISKSLDSLSFVSSPTLPCPIEKIDSSPPPRRRFTHSNPPVHHAVILESAGKEYPSISVTQLTEESS